MKLWAISDLHVGFEKNRHAVQELPAHPEDWLIIAGDTGETPAHLDIPMRGCTIAVDDTVVVRDGALTL